MALETRPLVGVLPGVFCHLQHPTIYGLVEEGVVGVHLKMQAQVQVPLEVALGTAPLVGVLPGVFWHFLHPTIYGLVEVVEEGVVGAHLKTQVQVPLGVPLGTAPLGVVH